MWPGRSELRAPLLSFTPRSGERGRKGNLVWVVVSVPIRSNLPECSGGNISLCLVAEWGCNYSCVVGVICSGWGKCVKSFIEYH